MEVGFKLYGEEEKHHCHQNVGLKSLHFEAA
jgi:hypothetical protein